MMPYQMQEIYKLILIYGWKAIECKKEPWGYYELTLKGTLPHGHELWRSEHPEIMTFILDVC